MAFEIKRNDRRPYFRVQLKQNGTAADLTTASAARFSMKVGSTVTISRSAMVFIDKPTGVVEYRWGATDTATSGDFTAEVEIDWGGAPAEYQTFPSTGFFAVKINDDLV